MLRKRCSGSGFPATLGAIIFVCALTGAALGGEERPPLPAHLTPPASGPVIVEVAIGDMADVMDVAGAWEVFEDTVVPSRGDHSAFRLYLVAASKAPVQMGGGMKVTPDYTFDNAPPANIIVVPAQLDNAKLTKFLRARHANGEALMSICTGAFQLAETGLLDGKRATTHHDYMKDFSKQFPRVTLMPGNRYVQSDATIFTAGGLTSGIDLALHIVALYFGEPIAAKTANYLEYSGTGWKQPKDASPVSD